MKLSKKKLQELKDKTSSIKDLRRKYFYTDKSGVETKNLLRMLKNEVCDFDQLIDIFKNIKDKDNDPCFYKLLENEELFKELIEKNLLCKEDLRKIFDRLDKWVEFEKFDQNSVLLRHTLDNNIISFEELVSAHKITKDTMFTSCLIHLLNNHDDFKYLIQRAKLTKEDFKYLLNTISEISELEWLCYNTPLIKHFLKEFLLDRNSVDFYAKMIETSKWCTERNIHTIFDYIDYCNKRKRNDEELSDLNELNKALYLMNNFDFNKKQKLELAEIVKDSEVAQNRLIQIIKTNLEDQYNFEALKNLLTKDLEKKKIKLNL